VQASLALQRNFIPVGQKTLNWHDLQQKQISSPECLTTRALLYVLLGSFKKFVCSCMRRQLSKTKPGAPSPGGSPAASAPVRVRGRGEEKPLNYKAGACRMPILKNCMHMRFPRSKQFEGYTLDAQKCKLSMDLRILKKLHRPAGAALSS